MNFKRPKKLLLSLTMLFAFSATAQADIPLMVPYAGSVAVGGEAFDGSGQFKFAIVNKSCTIEAEIAKCLTLWSNDATSATGLEPTDAVQIPVSNGGFSVKLGDTGLTGMTEIPATVFENDVTFLRVWFNDGVAGFQQLSNDRQLVSVPYAYHADTAKTASKVVTGGINADAIADTSIGAAKIIPAEVQKRVQACEAGKTIESINEDGSVVCIPSETYTAGSGLVVSESNEFAIDPDTLTKIDSAAAKSINTGTGLASSTANGTQTISIADGGVSNAHISGVNWNKISGIPAELSDGDQVGILTETDPKVGTLTNNKVCTSNGSQVICNSNFPSESDPQVGSLTNGRWCTSNGSQVNCTTTFPSITSAGITDSTIEDVDIRDDTTLTATDFKYNSTKTFYHHINAVDFQITDATKNTDWQASMLNGGKAWPLTTGQKNIAAGFHLPNGAKISNAQCYYYDSAVLPDITLMRFRITARSIVDANAYTTVAYADNSPALVADGTVNYVEGTSTHVVNNETYSYLLRMNVTATAAGNNSTAFHGCRITYTLNTIAP